MSKTLRVRAEQFAENNYGSNHARVAAAHGWRAGFEAAWRQQAKRIKYLESLLSRQGNQLVTVDASHLAQPPKPGEPDFRYPPKRAS